MYRTHRGDRKESEYTHTAAGVDLHVLDQPSESERLHVGTLAFPCILGWSSLILLKSTHILHLGGSPGAYFLGTTTIELAQGLMLFLMTSTRSNVLISC